MGLSQLTTFPGAFAHTTAEGTAEERRASWQRAYCRTFVDVRVSLRDPASWTGTLRGERLGSLQIAVEESGGPATIERHPAAAAQDHRSPVLLRRQLGGSAVLLQDGRAVRLDPGGLAFHDAARPFRLALSGPQRALVLMLPRALLRLEEPRLRLLTATELDPAADDATAALLCGLAEETLAATPERRDQLARTTADLAATVALRAAAAGEGQAPEPTTALVGRIKDFVDARLGDPDLSPLDIAAAHAISLRYLHRLFQRQGTTVSSFVRTRRLEAARSELMSAEGPRRPVAAVAARWGFTSAAHFSRVFRHAFGMTPLQCRNAGRVDDAAAGECTGRTRTVRGGTSFRPGDS